MTDSNQTAKFAVGDRVIYHKQKTSDAPGPRAREVKPFEHGEDYAYEVDKFWTVSAIIDRETIEVLTRTGKVHRIQVNDPLLEKAGLKDKILHRDRFPAIPRPPQADPPPA